MAPTKGTPTRPIRIEPTLWEQFGAAVATQGSDRSAALREFIRWYVREPGAKMPKRPDVAPAESKIDGNNSGTNQSE